MMLMGYDEAVRQLEEIVRKMENEDFDVESLSEQLKKSQQLIKLCKTKLTKTENEIEKLLKSDKK